MYNGIENIFGETLRKVEEKLGLDPGVHTVQWATREESTGGCETCETLWDSFQILVDGDEVYSSGFSSSYLNPIEDLTDWLEDRD